VQGTESGVRLNLAEPDLLLPEHLRGQGRWVLESHSHPVTPGGLTTPEADWVPSGAAHDFGVVTAEGEMRGRPYSSEIRIETPHGPDVTRFEYDPTRPAEPYGVDMPTAAGGREQHRFATIEDYHDWYQQRYGGDLGPIPDNFPGPRRSGAPPTGAEPGLPSEPAAAQRRTTPELPRTEPPKTEPPKTDPIEVEATAPAKFPTNEFPTDDATWKQWPPPQEAADKPDWNKPGGARYRYDRYRYQKWQESGKSTTPPKDLLSPEQYYDRYVAPKAVGQSPGEMGSPQHKALVVRVREDNGIGTHTMGEQRPDAVGERGQIIKIPDGPRVKPQEGGRVLYEADNFFKDGSQITSEGREQVRQFRKDNPDATIVVQDVANPKNIIEYEPGTQPPPPGPLSPGTPNKVSVR
jgi:hypothetical protein